ncbi:MULTISPECIES: hypothetical protein [Streptomyces]|nr:MULTISPECIES: hypothetical protein [Streptomyces]WUC88320.1 hypothetical protein OHQ35_20360 [Streptomyces anulatus]WUD90483.1 hypothetical protein OG703_20885 [Streptomyces anulatus]
MTLVVLLAAISSERSAQDIRTIGLVLLVVSALHVAAGSRT